LLKDQYVDENGITKQGAAPACGKAGTAGNGDKWQTRAYAYGFGLAITAVFTGYFAYKGFISKSERAPAGATTGRRSKPPRNLVVTPVVTPDGAGATLRLDW